MIPSACLGFLGLRHNPVGFDELVSTPILAFPHRGGRDWFSLLTGESKSGDGNPLAQGPEHPGDWDGFFQTRFRQARILVRFGKHRHDLISQSSRALHDLFGI